MEKPDIWPQVPLMWDLIPLDADYRKILIAFLNEEVEVAIKQREDYGLYWRRNLNEDRELGL